MSILKLCTKLQAIANKIRNVIFLMQTVLVFYHEMLIQYILLFYLLQSFFKMAFTNNMFNAVILA